MERLRQSAITRSRGDHFMSQQFDVRAEREYYKSPPTDSVITPDHLVEWQMTLSTGSSSWPTLLHNQRVLEVGAGECSYLKYLLMRANPLVYIAQDIFSERMQPAQEFGNYLGADFIASDVLHLPFHNGSFDLCMAFGLLHHIPNRQDALAEIARVLKAGGKFIFRDPSADNPAIWLKYKFGEKSQNEFPLFTRQIKFDFTCAGLHILHLNLFWLRFPKLPSGPWSVNIGGLAMKT